MNSTILFYKFFPVTDPALFRLWQRELCLRLGLKGRLIVSKHGINGTLGGSENALKQYLLACHDWPMVGKLDVKWAHNVKDVPFPKLSVKNRDELVTFNFAELEVDEAGVKNAGTYLSPKKFHELLMEKCHETGHTIDEILGKEILMLDGRNDYEYEVGHFKNSLDSQVKDAKGFIPLVESGALDEWKQKPIITYCTGGIRCEILTPILKQRGFEQVYQLHGGIVKYLEKSQNDLGLWEGSVYTFDTRKKVWDDLAPVIAHCAFCQTITDRQENCRVCETQVVVCDACWPVNNACPECVSKI